MKIILKIGSIFGLLLIALSFILCFKGYSSSTAVFLPLVGLLLFAYCQSKKCLWKCTECGDVFKINMIQFLLGINTGDTKLLTCKKCDKKTNCKPIKDDSI